MELGQRKGCYLLAPLRHHILVNVSRISSGKPNFDEKKKTTKPSLGYFQFDAASSNWVFELCPDTGFSQWQDTTT